MTRAVMPYLKLLGPVCIDTFQSPTANRNGETEKQERTTRPRFRSRRTVALLGYLAAERRPIGRDFLSSFFWPDESHSHGRACLRRELYNLGQNLPDCWEMDRQKVAFVPDQNTIIDIYSILDLMDQEQWAEASDLLRGDFLEGIILDNNAEFELWLLSERDRWRVRAEEVFNHVIQGQKRRGRYSEALQHTRRLLKLSPWNEGAHQTAMRLLAWTGQRGAALRQYQKMKEILRQEINIEPADETLILYQQIKEGDLDLPPQPPAFLTAEKPRHRFELPPFVGRQGELTRLDHHLDRALGGQGQVAFIIGGPGRGKTALLDNFTQRAMEQYPRLLIASGKGNAYSGAGDPFLPFREIMGMLTGDVEGMWDSGTITRDHAQRLWAALPLVVQTLLDHGRQLMETFVPGKELLSRAVNVEGANAAWIQELRELFARQITEPATFNNNFLFQQMTRVLFNISRAQPLVLILDDLQWVDPASVSLLFHLGRRVADRSNNIFMVCAYRPEEIIWEQPLLESGPTERHPLAYVLNEFKRIYGDVWVDLSQPEDSDNRGFIDALVDTEPNQLSKQFRDALFRRTEGHPLFTIELLRTMQEREDLLRNESGHWIARSNLDWSIFPARVEAVIEERVNRLEPGLQEILSIASVEGETFTGEVVSMAGKIPVEEVLHQFSLDLERRHRLVREREEIDTGERRLTRFRFSHALFQEYLYNRQSQGERRLRHRRIGGALEHLYQPMQEAKAVQLAHHFDLGDDHSRAFHYYALAAEHSARLYATKEVQGNYTKAIKLAEVVNPEAPNLIKLYRGRGLISGRLGDFDQAQVDHQTSLQLARAEGEEKQEWRAFIDLGRLWAARDYQRTRRYFEGALDLSRRLDDPLLLANSLNWMGNWHTNAESVTQAVKYHQQALEIAEKQEDRRELANTLDLLGVAKLMAGDLAACIHYYDQAVTLQREQGDRLRLISSLTGRAVAVSAMTSQVCVPVIPLPDGVKDSQEAIEIADEIGDLPGKAWALYAQGMVHLLQGRFGLAEETLLTGLELSLKIKHQEYIVANRFGLGLLFLNMFAPEQALEHLEKALPIADRLRSPAMIHNTIGPLAGALLMINDLEGARNCLEKVLSPDTSMDTLGKRICWVRKVELALARDDPVQALKIVDRLIAAAPGKPAERVITSLWKLKGDALVASNRAEEALPWLQAARQNIVKTKERCILWQVQDSLGRAYSALGQKSEAEDAFLNAKELTKQLAKSIPDQEMRDNYLERTLAEIGPSS